jgi:uncharacterized protein YjaG (DUF416 family)
MIGEENSLASLATLSRNKQLAFALLVFERMLPSLIAFSKDTGRDASCYLRARDAAWVALQNVKDGIADQSLNEACIKNAPDTEEYTHELTSYALNAALTMSDILEFTADRRSDHITYIATLATDSVHLYLSSLSTLETGPGEWRLRCRNPRLRAAAVGRSVRCPCRRPSPAACPVL